jgi:hypothetical protein
MEHLISIKKVVLGERHSQPERVGATITAESTTIPKPPFASLEIAHYPGEDSCYLFHISSNGEGTDTFHETLDEALDYAQVLYGVQPSEWLDVNQVFGSNES